MRYASERLGVILSAYTVYLDLWLCDLDGRVIANGRPDRYPHVRGSTVAHEPWFRRARQLPSGDAFVADDVRAVRLLGGAQVATYCAGVREEGHVDGRPLGVLAIHFDWEPQARAIVDGVRVAPEDRERTRVLRVDASRRVLAASDGRGILSEIVRSDGEWGAACCAMRGATPSRPITAHPATRPIHGLGWYGVIVQTAARLFPRSGRRAVSAG